MAAFPYRYVSKPFWYLAAVLLVASALSVLLIGCGGSGGKLPNSMGPIQPITIKAQFPSAQGRAHDTITSAWVGVTGPGMTPITQQMTYDASTFTATGTVDVPTGLDRTVQVDAKDAEDAIVFTGQTTGVEIIGGETLQLDMTVEAAFTEATPSAIDYTKMVFTQALSTETAVAGTPSGAPYWVSSVAFSPDGNTLASADGAGRVILWDAQTGVVKRAITVREPFGQAVYSVAFSPDGNTLASNAETLKLWDVETGALLRTIPDAVIKTHQVAFSPDGNILANGGRLFDAQTGMLIHTINGGFHAFAPDGLTLVATRGNTVKILDVQTGAEKLSFAVNHERAITSVAFSPDGTTLASGSEDTTVKLWDAQTGALKLTIIGHELSGSRLSVAFSPDGTTLASGSEDTTAKLWDVSTGMLKVNLYDASSFDYANQVAFSPDGRTLAIAQEYNAVTLFRVP